MVLTDFTTGHGPSRTFVLRHFTKLFPFNLRSTQTLESGCLVDALFHCETVALGRNQFCIGCLSSMCLCCLLVCILSISCVCSLLSISHRLLPLCICLSVCLSVSVSLSLSVCLSLSLSLCLLLLLPPSLLCLSVCLDSLYLLYSLKY